MNLAIKVNNITKSYIINSASMSDMDIQDFFFKLTRVPGIKDENITSILFRMDDAGIDYVEHFQNEEINIFFDVTVPRVTFPSQPETIKKPLVTSGVVDSLSAKIKNFANGDNSSGKQKALAREVYDIIIQMPYILSLLYEDYPFIYHYQVLQSLEQDLADAPESILDILNIASAYIAEIDRYITETFQDKYYIDVPVTYSDEQEAKALGAKWDDEELRYYFTDRNDAYKFGLYLPVALQFNDDEQE